MAKLKSSGMGNMKMFTAEDFAGMSPEQMAEKVRTVRDFLQCTYAVCGLYTVDL